MKNIAVVILLIFAVSALMGKGSTSHDSTITSDDSTATIAPVVATGSDGLEIKSEDQQASGSEHHQPIAGFLEPREIARRVMRSIVLVQMHDSVSGMGSSGSGFLVKPGIVATSLHVVIEAQTGTVKLVGSNEVYSIKGIIGIDSNHDLALLSVPGLPASPIQCGNDTTVAPGDTVYAAGNPVGYEGTFSVGILSAKRTKSEALQITAPVSPGSSGSPVLDSAGKVIGIVKSIDSTGQNLNFAVPVRFLKALLVHQYAQPISIADLYIPRQPSQSYIWVPPAAILSPAPPITWCPSKSPPDFYRSSPHRYNSSSENDRYESESDDIGSDDSDQPEE